jgi:hypothetical protein
LTDLIHGKDRASKKLKATPAFLFLSPGFGCNSLPLDRHGNASDRDYSPGEWSRHLERGAFSGSMKKTVILQGVKVT